MFRAKLYMIGAAVGAVLLGMLKFLSSKVKREGKRADRAEARADYVEEVRDLDHETGKKFTSRRSEAAKEVEAGRVPEHLLDPNRELHDD